MKHHLLFLPFFILLSLLCCAIYGFSVHTDAELIADTVIKYRIFISLLCFFRCLPAVLCSGYVVVLSVRISKSTQSSSTEHFSEILFSLFKSAFCVAAAIVSILSLIVYVFNPLVEKHKKQLERRPFLFSEYMTLANRSMATSDYEMALAYANQALSLDKSNDSVRIFLRVAENQIKSVNINQRPQTIPSFNDDDTGAAELEKAKLYTVHELLRRSKEAAAMGQWFNAHYYAQLAVQTSPSDNLEIEEAKRLAADAWNKISDLDKDNNGEYKDFFASKKKGYAALMSKDYSRAYYIFDRLLRQFPAYSSDPDVVQYLSFSRERLESQVFFIDETYGLDTFEHIANVCFRVQNEDLSFDIVMIHNITDVKGKNGLIRYLRNMIIYRYDKNGVFICSVFAPYAKMLAEYTLDARHPAPHILLRSVDRNYEGVVFEPQYFYANSDKTNGPAFIDLQMPYSDVQLIMDTSGGAQYMSILSLFKFVPKASQYGYSRQMYGLALENFLLYPFKMFILLLFFALVAWNYRLPGNYMFKFVWIFSVPVIMLFMYFLLECADYFFTLINFACVGISGNHSALPLTVFIYVIMLLALSMLFLSRKAE